MKVLQMIARDVFGATSEQATASQSTAQARAHRTWMALVAALVSCYWVGPHIPTAWFVVIVVYEHIGAGFLIRRFITPHNRSEPEKARWRAVQLSFAAAALYVMAWAPAYFTGKPGTEYFAAAWLACAIINSLVYTRPDRWQLVGNLAPAFITLLIGAVLLHGWSVTALLLVVVSGRLLLSTNVGHRDRMLLLANVKLNRSQRKAADEANAAKSEFLATMSYELRTPLNAIIGYSELLEEELEAIGQKSCAEDALRIKRAGRNLLTLINEVLDFSKIEAGRMELRETEADIGALIRQAVETCTPVADANGTTIDLAVSADIGALVLDADRLRQCVLNLLSNACKFTKGGFVSVGARLERQDAETELVIDVKDSGVGIAPAQAKRLFQPFVQADSAKTRAHEGTGLGLVITKRLAQLMGGDVSFESALGEGSCFTLRVRVKRIASALAAERRLEDCVVVVEDDPAALDMYRRMLSDESFDLVESTGARQGEALIRAQQPRSIILDLHLADGSGWDLLAALKQDSDLRHIPVIVVSIDDDRPRSLALGASEHFVKPVDRDRLIDTLRRQSQTPRMLEETARSA